MANTWLLNLYHFALADFETWNFVTAPSAVPLAWLRRRTTAFNNIMLQVYYLEAFAWRSILQCLAVLWRVILENDI